MSVNKPHVPLDVFDDPVTSNKHRSPSVFPTATAVDASSEVGVSDIVIQSDLPRPRKARQNQAYVEISRPKHPKCTTPLSSSNLEWAGEPLPKKLRSTHRRASESTQRSESRIEPEAARAVSSTITAVVLLSPFPCSSLRSLLVANRRQGAPRKMTLLEFLTETTSHLFSRGQWLAKHPSSPSPAPSIHLGLCREGLQQLN